MTGILILFLFETMFTDTIYYVMTGVLTVIVLVGIFLMSKVKTSRIGNFLSAVAMALGILVTVLQNDLLPYWILYVCLAAGALIGLWYAYKIKMIEMPQGVALLNGLGGIASAIVGGYAFLEIGAGNDVFSQVSAIIALEVGSITFFGSLVAAGKLQQLLPQKPVSVPYHQVWLVATLVFCLVLILLSSFYRLIPAWEMLLFSTVASMAFGILLTLRIGGADMPIVISLLNSLSGVAGAICGLAIIDPLLVSIGGIVGASGLLLTRVMCKAMNRRLFDILLGKKPLSPQAAPTDQKQVPEESKKETTPKDPIDILKAARNVIVVPGYGMAIAQAQHLVKSLADALRSNKAQVRYAIHPVAGRMPGHMNVLLAEANVDYDDLYDMEILNSEFKNADLTIVIGANDVINPAAREAKGTPISGMPILNVDQCRNVFIFNYDLKPGYAGVENPIYQRHDGIYLFLGNALETLKKVLDDFGKRS